MFDLINFSKPFIIGRDVSGSPYCSRYVQGLVNQPITPLGFFSRSRDTSDEKGNKTIFVNFNGSAERGDENLSLHHFSTHPPPEEIRKKTTVKVI